MPLDSENTAMLISPLAVHELLLFIPKKHSVSLGVLAVCAGSGDPVQSYMESLL